MTTTDSTKSFELLKKRVRLAKLFAATIDGDIHFLKTINPYFQLVWDDLKTAELRYNDRHFKVGDTLVSLEYEPGDDDINKVEKYSGRFIITTATNIIGEEFPLALISDYVMLSFNKITQGSIENIEEIINPDKFGVAPGLEEGAIAS